RSSCGGTMSDEYTPIDNHLLFRVVARELKHTPAVEMLDALLVRIASLHRLAGDSAAEPSDEDNAATAAWCRDLVGLMIEHGFDADVLEVVQEVVARRSERSSALTAASLHAAAGAA